MKSNLLICRLMFMASIIFIFLTLAAMVFYPGGTYSDHSTVGYSFTSNFFSDLGTSKTYSGMSNTVSMALFIIAMMTVGISLILFSRNSEIIYNIGSRGKMILHASKAAAVGTGILFIAVALFPADILLNLHIITVKLAFSMLLIFILLVTILQMTNSWEKVYLYIDYVYFLILCGYLYILFNGPDFNTPKGLMFNVVSQKIIVYVSIINIGIQSYGQIKYIRKTGLNQEQP